MFDLPHILTHPLLSGSLVRGMRSCRSRRRIFLKVPRSGRLHYGTILTKPGIAADTRGMRSRIDELRLRNWSSPIGMRPINPPRRCCDVSLIAGRRRPHHPTREVGLRVKSTPLTSMPHTRPMAGETKRE